jgi:hypothetical protein
MWEIHTVLGGGGGHMVKRRLLNYWEYYIFLSSLHIDGQIDIFITKINANIIMIAINHY